MASGLIADFKEYPATMGLCSLWVLVFVLMALTALNDGQVASTTDLFMSLNEGHRFGDMTLDEFRHGEVWRALTSTFIHFGIVHLGMNLYGMYQLGCMVESWYGSAQFLAVYVVIGGGGNVLSALIRNWLGSDPRVHSGGGSTVVLGLVALCAVVGWRSRTRIGDYLRAQMIGILVFTAILGQLVAIIDNWGHAGGALMGAIVGFAHRSLIRTVHRPVSYGAGGLAAALIVASWTAQWLDARAEDAAMKRWETAQGTSLALSLVNHFYRDLAVPRSEFVHMPSVPLSYLNALPKPDPSRRSLTLSPIDTTEEDFHSALKQSLNLLDSTKNYLGKDTTAEDFRRSRSLLARVLDRPPAAWDKGEFDGHMKALSRRARRDEVAALSRLKALGVSPTPRVRIVPPSRPAPGVVGREPG